jgi:hypothetical protein
MQCCGAGVGDGGSGGATFAEAECVNFFSDTKTPILSYLTLKLTLIISISLLCTLKKLFMIIYVHKKQENLLKR